MEVGSEFVKSVQRSVLDPCAISQNIKKVLTNREVPGIMQARCNGVHLLFFTQAIIQNTWVLSEWAG